MYSAVSEESFLYMPISSLLNVLSGSSVSFFDFLPVAGSGVFKSPAIIMDSSVSHFTSISFSFMHFEAFCRLLCSLSGLIIL